MEKNSLEIIDLGQLYDYDLSLGEYSVRWKILTNPLPVQKTDVLSQSGFKALREKDESELLNRLQAELIDIADTKIRNTGIASANVGYLVTSAAGICVTTPIIFDKLGFNLWQNICASSLLALTQVTPVIYGLFSMVIYPWARKIGGEIAKPFILDKLKNNSDAFLKSEGLLN